MAQLIGSFSPRLDPPETTDKPRHCLLKIIKKVWSVLLLSDDQVFGGIVHLALAQYPIHLYMVVAMRSSNEGLVGGDSENAWGFGQVVALVLASATVFECFRGVIGKYSYLILSNCSITKYRCTIEEYRRFLQLDTDSSPEPSAIPTHLALTPHEIVQVPPCESV